MSHSAAPRRSSTADGRVWVVDSGRQGSDGNFDKLADRKFEVG